MKKIKRKNIVIIVFLLLLVGISVGYAVLSTALNINGNTSINKATWDVHFENIQVTDGSVAAELPSFLPDDNTSFNYSVTLNKPGDYYELTVDVKNAGTIPAKLESMNINYSEVIPMKMEYIIYEITYSDGTEIKEGDLLGVDESKNIRIRLEYDSEITESQLPNSESKVNITYSMNYSQA